MNFSWQQFKVASHIMKDYDQNASKMAEANRGLPAPVVAVNEINRVTNRVSVIETNTSF